MAKRKFKGRPGEYIKDLAHVTLGKFDEKGEFETDDPDVIRRLEMLEEEVNSNESPGEKAARLYEENKYKEYKKIAEVMVDVMVERGILAKGKGSGK